MPRSLIPSTRLRRLPFLLLLPVILLLASCSVGPSTRIYEHPDGFYSIEVPENWPTFTNLGAPSRDPLVFTLFVGEEEPRDENEWLGAYIGVHRIPRLRKDHPGTDADFAAYRWEHLLPAEGIAASTASWVSTSTVAGVQAWETVSEFTHVVRLPNRRPIRIPMRMRSVVIRREDAFYVLEYKANMKSYPRYVSVFERAKKSFRLNR